MAVVAPASLQRYAAQLDDAAEQLDGVALRVRSTVPTGELADWVGPAARAYTLAAEGETTRLSRCSRQLRACAATVRRLADRLAAELAHLASIERRVGALLGRLREDVASAGGDVAREASGTLHWVRGLVLPTGSPGWREVGATLTSAGLL